MSESTSKDIEMMDEEFDDVEENVVDVPRAVNEATPGETNQKLSKEEKSKQKQIGRAHV